MNTFGGVTTRRDLTMACWHGQQPDRMHMADRGKWHDSCRGWYRSLVRDRYGFAEYLWLPCQCGCLHPNQGPKPVGPGPNPARSRV